MQTKVIITIDSDTGLNGRDIGRMIQRETRHVRPNIEITATPETIDIRFEKTYSEIAVTGPLYEKLAKAAKALNTTPEKILEQGAKRYGL